MTADRADHELRILRSVDEHQGVLIDFLQRLIRVPSLTGEEGPCAEVCAAKLRALGLEVDCWELGDEQFRAHPATNPSRFPYAGRPNVVGRWRGAAPERGRSLILNGHTDVVTPEPLDNWAHDPWGGEIAQDRVYGRGSVGVMKAPAWAAVWPSPQGRRRRLARQDLRRRVGSFASFASGFSFVSILTTVSSYFSSGSASAAPRSRRSCSTRTTPNRLSWNGPTTMITRRSTLKIALKRVKTLAWTMVQSGRELAESVALT